MAECNGHLMNCDCNGKCNAKENCTVDANFLQEIPGTMKYFDPAQQLAYENGLKHGKMIEGERRDIILKAINEIGDFFEYRYRSNNPEEVRRFVLGTLDAMTKNLKNHVTPPNNQANPAKS